MGVHKSYKVEVDVGWSPEHECFVASHNGWTAKGCTEYRAVAEVLAVVASLTEADTSMTDEEAQDTYLHIETNGIWTGREDEPRRTL